MPGKQPGSASLKAEPSLVANVALSWMMFAGRAAFAFITTALVARALGPAGRGEVSYVVNLAALLALVAGSGTAAALVQAQVRDHWSDGRLQRASVVVGVAAGALLGVAALAVIPLVDSQNQWKLLVVAAVAIPLVVLTNLTQAVSLSDRLGLITWTMLTGATLYAVGTAFTIALGLITVENNVLLWSLTAVLPLGLLIWPGGLRPWGGATIVSDSRRLLRMSVRSNVAAAAVLAIWRIDVVLVEAKRGYAELGLYVVAVGTAEIVLAFAISIRSAVLPHQGLRDPERLVDVLCQVTRISVVGVGLFAVAVMATGPWGMSAFFGSEYREAYPALVLLLPGVVLLVLHYPLFDYVVARGATRSLTIMGVSGVALNVILNLVLLEDHSYVAASLASTVTYLFVFAWCLRDFTRQANRSVRETLVMTPDDARALWRQVAVLMRRVRTR